MKTKIILILTLLFVISGCSEEPVEIKNDLIKEDPKPVEKSLGDGALSLGAPETSTEDIGEDKGPSNTATEKDGVIVEVIDENNHDAALDKRGVCARPTKYYFVKKGSMTNQAVLVECNEHRNTNHICKQSICSKCELTQTQSHATYRDCVGH